jgi:hypothetical protein
MNDLKHLVGKPIHIKLASVSKPLACTVSGVESAGLWIIGTPILEVVVHAGAVSAERDPVIFVPLHNIEWLVAALERAQS